MNYKKIYYNIINRAKTRVPLIGYLESHHIIPKCLGGNNNKDNLVDLTPEEHYVCHQLLVKIYPNNRSLLYAATMMCGKSPYNKRNNKLYGWIKKSLYQQKLLNCKECNKQFTIVKGRFKRENTKYCSMKCYHNNTIKNTDYSSFNCRICNKIFTIPSSHVQKGVLDKACSKHCGIKLKQMNSRIDLTCLNCNCKYNVIKSKSLKSKFCSSECNKKYKSKNAWITFDCLICKKISTKLKSFSKKTLSGKPKFCSHECYRIHKCNSMTISCVFHE